MDRSDQQDRSESQEQQEQSTTPNPPRVGAARSGFRMGERVGPPVASVTETPGGKE